MSHRKLTQAEIDAYREMAAAEKLREAQRQAKAERERERINAQFSLAEQPKGDRDAK
jgi:hypothetical protein